MSKRLIEAIRSGAVPDVIRRKACSGELPVSLEEKIEILVFLAANDDQETRDAALRTLHSWPLGELQRVLMNPATAESVLEFSTIDLASSHREVEDALLQNPSLPPHLREWLENAAAIFERAESGEPPEAPIFLPASPEERHPRDELAELRKFTLLQRINRMTPVQRIKAALTGSQEERIVLVRDSNKLVSQSVLESPKLSDHEVENFASMKDVDEEVLRIIGTSRKFIKNYRVLHALVHNPRTPIDVGIPLIKRTTDQDLKLLVLNRNVPQLIRIAAQKRLRQKELARKTTFHAQR
jgi:hypothetical protein